MMLSGVVSAKTLVLSLLVVLAAPRRFDTLLRNLASPTPDEEQAQAARDLFGRVLPAGRADSFHVVVDRRLRDGNGGLDVAHVLKEGEGGGEGDVAVSIRASSGATAAWALGHYLKEACRCHVSWDLRQLRLPRELPRFNSTLRAQDAVRFYQNDCTYGYSFVWWDWARWEAHLDWMALTGFNLALASSGQELAWRETFSVFGMTEGQLEEFFTGPAFLPWNRMGNLRGWGGPLGRDWERQDSLLQKRILARMRKLGMSPVTPGFNGIVPPEIVALHPGVEHYKLRAWGHFSEKYSASSLLSFQSDLARNISDTFLRIYSGIYGESNFFAVDTFNEMHPPRDDPAYLGDYGREMSSWLASFDPDAIWVMQGWLFRDDGYWTREKAAALLDAVPTGRMLVLDLASTTNPEFDRLDSYFGQPFVYCMLHNYGGTMGLYAKADTVNSGPHDARRRHANMVGTGMTPEGIHTSYVAYDLMSESFWRADPVADLGRWAEDYSTRRYGKRVEKVASAFRWLMESAYNCCISIDTNSSKPFRFHGSSALTDLPSLKMKQELWYEEGDVLAAWDLMVSAIGDWEGHRNASGDEEGGGGGLEAFRHDLVDLSRQAMANELHHVYEGAVEAFRENDTAGLRLSSRRFLRMVRDLDRMLGSRGEFLLGRWLELARSGAATGRDADAREFNARNQLTLWGPRGEVLDYAAKQWSGLVEDYYLKRWALFFRMLRRALKKRRRWRQKRFERAFLRRVGVPFTLQGKKYPTSPTGDAMEVVREMHRKWRRRMWAPYPADVVKQALKEP